MCWFGFGFFFGDDRAFYETEILKAACRYKDLATNNFCITSTACIRLFWIQMSIFSVEMFLILVMGITVGSGELKAISLLNVSHLDRTLFIGLRCSSGKGRESQPQGTRAGANVIGTKFIWRKSSLWYKETKAPGMKAGWVSCWFGTGNHNCCFTVHGALLWWMGQSCPLAVPQTGALTQQCPKAGAKI